MKILVVDDATSLRQRLMTALKRGAQHAEVIQAGSGEEAMELLEGFNPDLITLDLMMPGMSGIETLEAIRRSDPKVKIVVFTNYPYPTFRRRCMELGATQFFGKSTEIDRILDVLRGEDQDGSGAPKNP